MNCERYQDKLVDALANGEVALGAELAAHLRACGECRQFYEAQVHLFGAIDREVHTMMHEATPASLLPGVRARMEVENVQPSPFPWRIAAVAVLGVLVLIIPSLLQNRSRVKNVSPEVVGEKRTARDTSVSAVARELTKPAPSALQSQRTGWSTIHQTVRAKTGSPEVEVVIDPAEARGLQQLAKAAIADPPWALAMTRPGELPAMPGEATRPLGLPDREMKALDEKVQ